MFLNTCVHYTAKFHEKSMQVIVKLVYESQKHCATADRLLKTIFTDCILRKPVHTYLLFVYKVSKSNFTHLTAVVYFNYSAVWSTETQYKFDINQCILRYS